MRTFLFVSFPLLLILKSSCAVAQYKVIIPGYTGYAVPAENDEATEMFTVNKGLTNWTNAHQSIQYFSIIKKAGTIDVSLNARSASGTQLQLSAAGQSQTAFRLSMKMMGWDFRRVLITHAMVAWGWNLSAA